MYSHSVGRGTTEIGRKPKRYVWAEITLGVITIITVPAVLVLAILG